MRLNTITFPRYETRELDKSLENRSYISTARRLRPLKSRKTAGDHRPLRFIRMLRFQDLENSPCLAD